MVTGIRGSDKRFFFAGKEKSGEEYKYSARVFIMMIKRMLESFKGENETQKRHFNRVFRYYFLKS